MRGGAVYIKIFLIIAVTFLPVATSNSFAAETQTNEVQTEQKKDVPATPPKGVLRGIKGGMPLFGGGVGIKTMKPAPEKSTVMRCREQDARIMTMESPTNIGFPCD